MTHQEIFDKVLTALRAQGMASTSAGSCVYRDLVSGNRCAVGHLIKDEAYDWRLEGLSAASTKVTEALKKSGVPTDLDTYNLLVRLQSAHDSHMPRTAGAVGLLSMNRWEAAMKGVASDHGLIYTPPATA